MDDKTQIWWADLGSAPLDLIINQPGLFFGKGSVRDRDLAADGDFKGSCLFNLGIKQGAPDEEFPESVPILTPYLSYSTLLYPGLKSLPFPRALLLKLESFKRLHFSLSTPYLFAASLSSISGCIDPRILGEICKAWIPATTQDSRFWITNSRVKKFWKVS